MQPLLLRGHQYSFLRSWRGVPVYRADETDSMLQDRRALAAPAILTVAQVRAPATSEARWPGPPGNLYLSVPHRLPPDRAQRWLSDGVGRWLARRAPGVACAESWEGGFGAHRVGGRFVSGMVVAERAAGLDLHLRGRYPQDSEHVALASVCPLAVGAEAALWEVLAALV